MVKDGSKRSKENQKFRLDFPEKIRRKEPVKEKAGGGDGVGRKYKVPRRSDNRTWTRGSDTVVEVSGY